MAQRARTGPRSHGHRQTSLIRTHASTGAMLRMRAFLRWRRHAHANLHAQAYTGIPTQAYPQGHTQAYPHRHTQAYAGSRACSLVIASHASTHARMPLRLYTRLWLRFPAFLHTGTLQHYRCRKRMHTCAHAHMRKHTLTLTYTSTRSYEHTRAHAVAWTHADKPDMNTCINTVQHAR
jgi:hypothetical protein